MIADGFEISDELLWGLVRQYIRKNKIDGNLNATKEDLFAEAQASALMAVKQYRDDKGAKLSTWIVECVKNRLKNLNKYERIRPQDVQELTEDFEPTFSTQKEFEFYLTIKAILTHTEFLVFQLYFVEGESFEAIQEKMGEPRKKVEACFTRILHKYKSLVTSLDTTLMQRKLQDRWLDDSGSSQSELSLAIS